MIGMGGWVIGWIVGGAVVLVVVVLLLLMIRGAMRAAQKAEAILAALDQAETNTAPLWAVDTTNQVADRIVGAATAAREYLASNGAH